MNAVSGAALCAVRLRLQNASFQHRITFSNPVDAMPGITSGSSTAKMSWRTEAPSMRLASMMSFGVSRKNVNSIHTTIGRFDSV